jgi:hypothetical protein
MNWDLKLRRTLFVCTGVLVLLDTNSDDVVLAKVGLQSFTQAQQDWFWKKADLRAKTQAIFKICGHHSDFEERIIAAVQDCATAEAIQKVRAVFDRKIDAYVTEYSKVYNDKLCHAPGVIHLFAMADKELDSDVENVTRACSMCVSC